MTGLVRTGRALTMVLLVSAMAVNSACGTETEGADPTRTLVIESPEAGAEVTVPLTVEVRSDVELGEAGDGYRIVYYVDGIEAGTASEATFEVDRLDTGPHAIHVSLVGPDGELAGAEDEVTVTVTGEP